MPITDEDQQAVVNALAASALREELMVCVVLVDQHDMYVATIAPAGINKPAILRYALEAYASRQRLERGVLPDLNDD